MYIHLYVNVQNGMLEWSEVVTRAPCMDVGRCASTCTCVHVRTRLQERI